MPDHRDMHGVGYHPRTPPDMTPAEAIQRRRYHLSVPQHPWHFLGKKYDTTKPTPGMRISCPLIPRRQWRCCSGQARLSCPTARSGLSRKFRRCQRHHPATPATSGLRNRDVLTWQVIEPGTGGVTQCHESATHGYVSGVDAWDVAARPGVCNRDVGRAGGRVRRTAGRAYARGDARGVAGLVVCRVRRPPHRAATAWPALLRSARRRKSWGT